MKSISTLLLLVVFVFNTTTSFSSGIQSLNQSVTAASVQDFGHFRVHRMANDASLNWVITNPEQAAYFVIEKSYDGSYWPSDLQIEMEASGYANYKLRDNAVFPGFIYYRIKLVQLDGTVITSATEMLRIVKRG